ncbi:MAG: NDP-hexose 2,3-dehydratase family protein [Clostridiales bacterium]|nr:NDP-hexose 2,3-dehydratase family protein [Clostridiales bacterium]HAW15557.1 dNDP-4-keto-6-deoxy-glucose-2,3- dehydratase [Clostridiales bacterium]
MSIIYEIIRSWKNKEGSVNTMEQIMDWIDSRNNTLKVEIKKESFSYDGFWYFDKTDGYVRNKNNSFFQLAGFQEINDDHIVNEQPIIIQNEIGYLGIICKMINGTLNFLMQAKVEPGNVNVIQLSPTIQATKSNFTKRHGGNAPSYLDYFNNTSNYQIIVDQIQSEQSSRFYKKRNRNIIINIGDTEINTIDSHMWMTLGQIKECMKIDNLVNMDTRTVLSCIPFSCSKLEDGELEKIRDLFDDKFLFESMFCDHGFENIANIFSSINNYKMYSKNSYRLVPLSSLKNWDMTDEGIVCKKKYDFKVVYCYIEIEGREVNYWEQPLVEAMGQAVFGIFTCVKDGCRYYLVRVKPEIGCFDGAELGPIVQLEPTNPRNHLDKIEKLFLKKMNENEGIIKDVILSEEGGRFYHEQNRNVIIEIDKDELCSKLPEGYYWAKFSDLNYMTQFNNCLNIQLRNLISLLDI